MPKIKDFLDISSCPELVQAYDQAILYDSDYLAWWYDCSYGNALAAFTLSLGIEEKVLIRAVCDCVGTVTQFVPVHFQQPSMQVLEAVEAWTNNLASQGEAQAKIDSLRNLVGVCDIRQSARCAIATITMSINQDVETTVRFVADTWAISKTEEDPADIHHSDCYVQIFEQINQVCANIIRDRIPLTVVANEWSKYH